MGVLNKIDKRTIKSSEEEDIIPVEVPEPLPIIRRTKRYKRNKSNKSQIKRKRRLEAEKQLALII